jgi:glycosyltransferase involved in cell wall biosynthesis
MKPKVTVLMAVHDGELFVGAAIESVLAQTWRDFEFLIIDDASTDATPERLAALRDERVRVVRNETNLGLTASLNRGLALARGELIARQDADDLSHPRRLEEQAAFLAAHPSVAAVGSQAWLIDGRGRSLGKKDFPLGHRSIWWSHLFDNALAHSAVTFRRAAIAEAGGYDEAFRASQDYDLWSRLGERHLLANLPARLVTLRILETSVTRTHRQPELIRRVQAAHFSRLFPGREASREVLELIGSFRSRVEPEALERFYALFGELRAAYHAAWPETRVSGDFARTLALQIERIGYNLLPVARRAGLLELARAVRVWPPRALALPWVRIAALALLGDGARGLYERLFSKAKPAAK